MVRILMAVKKPLEQSPGVFTLNQSYFSLIEPQDMCAHLSICGHLRYFHLYILRLDHPVSGLPYLYLFGVWPR